MGSWKLTAAHTSAIVVSSGVVAVEGKDDDATADFSLRYGWLKEQMEKAPKKAEYEMRKLSPVSLSKAVKQNNLANLGTLETITKTVDVAYELKRCYRHAPKCGGDLLNGAPFRSIPWDISVVMNVLKEA